MLESYEDIRRRIPQPPDWWDECGVPRYDPFHPRLAANIYADEVALVHIACQNCGQPFRVAMSWHAAFAALSGDPPSAIADRIRDGSLHYGDPPNIGCCAAGASMNCEDLAVLQYWHRPRFDWLRDSALEISLQVPA